MQLVVELPEVVVGMSQLAVEISETRVEVSVEGDVLVDTELPRRIDEDNAVAKFAKKATPRLLRITAPYA